MSFSQQGNNGLQIVLKTKPKPNYIGPSQLGYSNNNPTMVQSLSNKIFDMFSPSKQDKIINSPRQKTLLFSNVAIVSKKAKKVLDVCQDHDKKGMLIIYQDFKQPNQRFDIIKVGDYVNIINKQNGKLLTVGGNSQRNGAPIFEQPLHELVGQKFRLSALQNNEYLIHTFCGKVLDCCEQRTSNGTPVIQWKCDRKQHQMWIIK